MNEVTVERRGAIGILRPRPLDPGAAGTARLAALAAAVDAALADREVAALVLVCPDDPAPEGPETASLASLRGLCDRIEAAKRPVVAVLPGLVQGDMAELALAAHYRIAGQDARFGFPGIAIGLPPRAGSTQRLPRLIGAEAALEMLFGGQTAPVTPALCDGPLAEDPLEAALALAATPPAPRPTGERAEGFADPGGYMRAVARARRALPQPQATARRIAECVEAAILLPLEGGLEMEHAAFQDCAASEASRALSKLARARAGAWAVPEAGDFPWSEPGSVAVIGATRLAADLVLACLEGGIETRLVELDPKGRAAVLERVLAHYDERIEAGGFSEGDRDRRLARLSPEAGFEDLADVRIVWEAAAEQAALKTELWKAIGLLTGPDAVLLTAGEVLPLAPLAEAAGRPDGVLGLHLAGIGPGAPLLELVLPEAPRAGDAAGALALVRRLGKQVVRCTDRAGFVVHRLRTALERRIEALMIAGAEAEAVDEALMAAGFRASPCFAMDVEGLDRVLQRRRTVAGRGTPAPAELSLLDALVETGLTGREEGAGLFRWADGAPAGDDPESRAVMNALAEAKGIVPRAMGADEIRKACLAALANAGAHMVSDETVLRAGDIDVAATAALGFPQLRGGPMAAADLTGLIAVERHLSIAPDDTPVSALFSDCIKRGRGFTDEG